MTKRTSNWIRKAKRSAIYDRDAHRCVYCGRHVVPGAQAVPEAATLDHVVAVENGGTNEAKNLVTCCLSCNCRKQALPLAAWARRFDDEAAVLRRVRNARAREVRRVS